MFVCNFKTAPVKYYMVGVISFYGNFSLYGKGRRSPVRYEREAYRWDLSSPNRYLGHSFSARKYAIFSNL